MILDTNNNADDTYQNVKYIKWRKKKKNNIKY